MIFYDARQPGPNPVTVRLFVHERRGLKFDVQLIDLAGLENRKRPYRENVNARGEVPALRLDDGKVITEITAICGVTVRSAPPCAGREPQATGAALWQALVRHYGYADH